MKIKGSVLIISATAAVLLTGCSSVNDKVTDYIGEQMLLRSDIVKDENYEDYKKYIAEGKIDENGNYVENTDESEDDHALEKGQVRVTLATNHNLKIEYSINGEHINGDNASECYLNPGEQLRATVDIAVDVYSSEYEFSAFRIYEWDGDKRTESSLSMAESNGEWILDVPADYTGTELSVVPVGTYGMRTIAVDDYSVDENGNHISINGSWKVNGTEITGSSAEISSVTSYTVSYEYDASKYFYVTSNPTGSLRDSDDDENIKIVTFEEQEADADTADYSVEIHEYLHKELSSSKNRTVSVIGGIHQLEKIEDEEVNSKKPLVLEPIKYTDKVLIETESKWDELEANTIDGVQATLEQNTEGQYQYLLSFNPNDSNITIDLSDYSNQDERGTIIFSLNSRDNIVTGFTGLRPNDKLYYSEGDDAEEGYWLGGGNNYILVSDEEQTKSELAHIAYVPRKLVKVSLPQPAVGGSIKYVVGNQEYTETTVVETYSGTEIIMKFSPEDHWDCKLNDKGLNDYTYEVSTDDKQQVTVNGQKVDELFTEKEDHKPKLSITLDKSLPEDMTFSVEGDNYSVRDIGFKSGFMADNKYDENKPGTNKPICVDVLTGRIPSGSALRMEVIKTLDAAKIANVIPNDVKNTDIQYITDAGDDFVPINIYETSDSEEKDGHCSSVSIKLSLVDDIAIYSEPTAAENTEIVVKNSTTKDVLKTGDLIEPSQDVDLAISPMAGYYLTGDKIKQGIYVKTLKYSEYLKKIDDDISGHSAAKCITIILGESDKYATYTYKLDGEVVTGTLNNVQEGQKLELTYEINDGEPYQLTEEHGGIVFGWGASTSKATEKISVTAEMDGKTIDKDLFGIATQKGE